MSWEPRSGMDSLIIMVVIIIASLIRMATCCMKRKTMMMSPRIYWDMGTASFFFGEAIIALTKMTMVWLLLIKTETTSHPKRHIHIQVTME